MKKRIAIIAPTLILLFAELNIDYSIGLADTGLVGLATLSILAISISWAFICLFHKKNNEALSKFIVGCSVIAGTLIGMIVTDAQLDNTKDYVETLAVEIKEIKSKKGAFPKDLSKLESFDTSENVPIGLLRKRRLHYSISEDGERFRMWFPYVHFLIAEYNSSTEDWRIHD